MTGNVAPIPGPRSRLATGVGPREQNVAVVV